HPLHDEIQRLIPTHAAPGIRAAIITNLRVEQSSRIAKNLVGAAAAHAEETLTVRIFLVAADGLQPAAFHLDQHSAKRWMAVHGTHGPNDFRLAASHGHFRLASARSSLVALPTETVAERVNRSRGLRPTLRTAELPIIGRLPRACVAAATLLQA